MSDEDEPKMPKAVLRAKMLLKLQDMTLEDRTARSEKICARVVDSSVWHDAGSVLLFSPLRTEPQITPLHTAAVAAGKTTTIIPPTLRIESELELPSIPQLILLPGLAFSRTGDRLGRGEGFFDRLLRGRGSGAQKMGICFAFQVQDRIPTEPHDASVDLVISD